MKITVKLFSVVKDIAGFEERQIDLAERAMAADVLVFLNRHNSQFSKWQNSLRLAVNYEYVSNDHPLNNGDEVAVIPPVSGG